MTDRTFDRRNEETRARLERLVASVTPAQLATGVGGGWTVASVLTHVGFWDRWQGERLREALAGGPLGMVEDTTEIEHLANEALEPYLGLAPASVEVARLALDAARALDGLIAGLSDESVAEVLASPSSYLVERFRHRGEHLDQIERALAAG